MAERLEEGQKPVAVALALRLLEARELGDSPLERVEVQPQMVLAGQGRDECKLGTPNGGDALKVATEGDEVFVGGGLFRSVDIELSSAADRVDDDGRDDVARRSVVALVPQVVHEKLGLLVEDRSELSPVLEEHGGVAELECAAVNGAHKRCQRLFKTRSSQQPSALFGVVGCGRSFMGE